VFKKCSISGMEQVSDKIPQVWASCPKTKAFYNQKVLFPFSTILQADPNALHAPHIGLDNEARSRTNTKFGIARFGALG
jgi:hypothetical protein